MSSIRKRWPKDKDKDKDKSKPISKDQAKDHIVPIRQLERQEIIFTHPDGLTSSQVETLLLQHGYNEVIQKQESKWKNLAMRYVQPIPIIMLVAVILAAALQPSEWLSFGLLLVEMNLLVWSAWRSEINTAASMAAIKDNISPEIDVKRDGGKWSRIKARGLVPGDIFLCKAGIIIPADAIILGDADDKDEQETLKVDESSLTGEALLATKKPGDSLLSGAVVKQGELLAQVTATGENTVFGRSMALLGGQQAPGRLQVLTKRLQIAILVGGLVIGFVIFLVLLFSPISTLSFGNMIRSVFVIIIAGAPVTLPVVVATILAVGARELAAEKAVVTRLSAIEELAGMDVLCSDKTGTLTLNELHLDEPYLCDEFTESDLYEAAVLASKREGAEAIDTAIFTTTPPEILASVENKYTVTKFVPFNPTDKKTLAIVSQLEHHGGLIGKGPRVSVAASDNVAVVAAGDGRNTEEAEGGHFERSLSTKLVFTVSKGSPDIINRMCHGNNPEKYKQVEDKIVEFASRGFRALGVAKRDGAISPGQALADVSSWQMIGLLSLFDPAREDSAEVIRAANHLCVDVKMITGDQLAIAIETCARLGLGTSIVGPEIWKHDGDARDLPRLVESVNGFAGVYPEHKYAVVEQLQKNHHIVGMTGDGVNDAAALKKAEVGIAVAGATEAARSSADIILSEPGLSTIVVAIKRARKTFLRLNFYMVYRIWASSYIYLFFLILYIGLRFPIANWLIVLLSLFKDVVVISTSKDKVPVAPQPLNWNLAHPAIVAIVMSCMSVLGSVIFTYVSLDRYGGWWHNFNIPQLTDDQVTMALFLHLLICACLTVLTTRTKEFFLKRQRRPSYFMLFIAIFVPIAVTFLAVYLPQSTTLGSGPQASGCGWAAAGITWAYSVVCIFLTEVVKLGAYYVLEFEANLRQKRKMELKEIQRQINTDLLQEEGLQSRFTGQQLLADQQEIQEQISIVKAELTRVMEENQLLKQTMLAFVSGQISSEQFVNRMTATPNPT